MKQCTCCKKDKPLDEFSWKSKPKNLLASECKSCHKLMRKRYYDGNKDSELSRVKERKRSLKIKYKEYKSSLSCNQCGFSHPAVIHFHHTDPTQKEIEVSKLLENNRSWDNLMKEIDKCIPLCANCHAILHWEELNNANIV